MDIKEKAANIIHKIGNAIKFIGFTTIVVMVAMYIRDAKNLTDAPCYIICSIAAFLISVFLF